MLFESYKSDNFNYSSTHFINTKTYFSYSKIGALQTPSGSLGPIDCGSFGSSKQIAQKKSFSESIERRSLVDIKDNTEKAKVPAFDLIRKVIGTIPKVYTVYNDNKFKIDTTGTAAHYDSYYALLNAYTEILEKNATFLFWYGGRGYKLSRDFYQNFRIYKSILIRDFTLEIYLNLDFYPLIVSYCKLNDNIKRSKMEKLIGVGSSISLKKSVIKSINEAFFLMNMYIEEYYRNSNIKYLKDSYEDGLLKTLDKKNLFEGMESLPTINPKEVQDRKLENLTAANTLPLLVNSLPDWLDDLWAVVLPQRINPNIIVFKVVSRNLMSCVPFKKNINLSLDINRKTINISKEILDGMNNCPIL